MSRLTQKNDWITQVSLRIFLPIVLIIGIIFRPCLLSLVYLLLYLYIPYLPVYNLNRGHTHGFLKLTLTITFLVVIAQIVFQIVLLSIPPYGNFLPDCSTLEKLFRHIGFIRINVLPWTSLVRWLAPDAFALVGTLFVFITITNNATVREVQQQKNSSIGTYFLLLALCVTSSLQPSVVSSVYYLIFLFCATCWALCYRLTGKLFVLLFILTAFICVCQILIVFGYQTEWGQELVDADSVWARLVGLVKIFDTHNICDIDPREGKFGDLEWNSFAQPVALLILYHLVVYQIQQLLSPPAVQDQVMEDQGLVDGSPISRITNFLSLSRKQTAHESTPLMTFSSQPRRYSATSGADPGAGDGHTQTTVLSHQPSSSQSQSPGDVAAGQNEIDEEDYVLSTLLNIFDLFAKSSYVATNIIMMAWSITYHSWLTFALLIGACILWMIPNQRRAMLYASPGLVLYAELLLLAQYVYSLDVDLPTDVNGFDLGEIGFVKESSPWKPILTKSAFTLMFWITLKQFVLEKQERRERREERRRQSMLPQEAPSLHTKTPTMMRLGTILRQVMTRFWIWIVAIMLFVIGLGGEKVVLYRIVYMALFLGFILTFQLSYTAWRKMMYIFWLSVIVYSMFVLIMIYTYQFKGIPDYISNYTSIPPQLQKDIGLETYTTGSLFVRLLTPTFFLVITVIQLHYFHRDFLLLSERRRELDQDSNRRSPTDIAPPPLIDNFNTKNLIANANYHGARAAEFVSKYYKIASNFIWRFLDVHIFKIVFFSAFLLTVYDPSSLHFLIFIAVICALTSESVQPVITHMCSIYISILLLAKMIYQIDYINHEEWNHNCSLPQGNKTVNNAEWLGLKKSSNLPELLKGYIGLILVFTIKAVVQNSGLKTFGILFPQIKRTDADKNLVPCLKYLANYCFYKFGVEITLITMVVVMGRRLDVFSVLYSFWLIPMFLMSRTKLSTIWLPFICFIAVLLPIQYLACIGLPPSICPEYPWEYWPYFKDVELKSWLFLPYLLNPPLAARLLPDFFLLLFACQQQRVFWIEKTTENYGGGSNKELGLDLYIHPSENPIPDFLTSSKSFLDTIKRRVFLTFYWFTLLAVFLTGTTRVNVFALGYLISSFIFLWEGNEFYLRSRRSIIKSWNFLLGFNVFVVFSKSIIQLIGCVFARVLTGNDYCWVVQIFGIACLNFGPVAFRATPISADSSEQCRLPHEEAGLLWDGIAFAFLLLQRRIFNSYYFFHIRNDTEAQNQLASRGAELIGELKQKQIKQQEAQERQVLEKIKTKMDKIKAIHEKGKRQAMSNHFDASSMIGSSQISLADDNLIPEAIPEPKAPLAVFTHPTPTPSTATNTISVDGFFEPPTYAHRGSLHPPHFSPTDESFPVFSPPPNRTGAGVQTSLLDKGDRRPGFSSTTQSPALSHHTSIRSGDYYMFDEYEDEEEPMCMIDSIEEEDEDDKEGFTTGGRMTVSELMASALKSGDVETAAEMAKLARQSSEVRDESFDESLVHPSSSLRSRKRRLSRRSFSSKDRQRVPRRPAGEGGDDTAPLAISDGSGTGGGGGGGGDEPPPPPPEAGEPGSEPSAPETARPYRPTLIRRLVGYLKFAWAFLESVMTSMTAYLNKFSKDYRHVARSLAEEKLMLKIATDKEIPTPLSPQEQKSLIETGQEPHVLVDLTKQQSIESELAESKDDLQTVVEKPSPSHPLDDDDESIEEVSVSELSSDVEQYPPVVLLLIAISYVIISHSDLLCYFIIFLNQINSASILSLPLPIMVLLWGTLSVPRPTKTFWVTIIAYTEAIIVIKYLFQFDFFSWQEEITKSPKSNPFSPPKILGIQKQAGSYATYDVILLMVVFFHRYMLKSLGLWKNVDDGSGHGSNGIVTIMVQAESEPLTTSSQQSTPNCDKNIVPGLTPRVIKLCVLQYLSSIRGFFNQILNLEYKVKIDVYSYMFMCDFFNFLVLIFGFSSFGSQSGDDVSKYLEENKVPVPFLVMIILQFALIIVDRALYLRKYILGKFFFQIFLVTLVHIAMFFLLPAVTERDFNAKVAPQLWYIVKCIYLLLSAYQIRCGYPTRILGNFLCKKYNYVNMFLFKGFMAVPFLFELRALMDWIWTDTSMTLSDWLKLEDIFAHIFQLKCQRRVEKEYPQGRGLPKARWSKYAIGGSSLFIIIAIIWFPLVLFALGNTIGLRNAPDEVSLEVSIGSYQPIFTMSTQSSSMTVPSSSQWDQFNKVFKNERTALNFLGGYDYDDMVVAKISGNSESVWGISPPAKTKLIQDLNSTLPLTLRLTWTIKPNASNSDKAIVAKDKKEIPLVVGGDARADLVRAISSTGENDTDPVTFNGIFPKFLRVWNTGKTTIPTMLQVEHPPDPYFTFRNISLTLKKALGGGGTFVEEWWDIRELCDERHTLPMDSCGDPANVLSLFTFNDKAFPSTLTFLSGGGIIGLYTTLVLVASKFVRNFFSGISFLIMFDDMPNVDRIFQLCLDIYLVRESGELALEEDLFAKLIFLYRSPETLIKWTRPKVEDQPTEEGADPGAIHN